LFFTKYAEYNVWAGDKTREVLSNLSNEEYLQDLGEPFTERLNTIQDLMEHSIQGLEFVLSQMSNEIESFEALQKKIPDKKTLTLQMSIDRWKKVDEDLLEFVRNNKISGTALFPIPDHDGVQVAKKDLLFQFFNHTLYHRGQIMLALNKLGKETVGTDYIKHIFNKMFAKNK